MKNIDILIKKIAERYDIEIIEGSNHHEVVKENGDVITPNEDSFWKAFGIPFRVESAYDVLLKNKNTTEISNQSLMFGDTRAEVNQPLIYNNTKSSNTIKEGDYQYAIAA